MKQMVDCTAYLSIFPSEKGKLIDLFHGNERLMWMGLLCSVLIFLPALFQLNLRLKRRE